MRPEGRNRGGPSPDFVSLVKDALEHLYDPARLGDHPLVGLLLPERLPSGASRAQALRQALLDGIDRLDPGPAVPAGSRAHRAQQVLALRYVEALSYREAMAELGLSQTQFHRDQRHAFDCLAALLWETASARWHEETPDGAGVDRATGRRGDGETGVDAETGRRGD
ncbi:MAG: hypothetical protein HYY04_14895, partial [Chloroflexi bacterium]|nr:hypothetical protein [Chloroflexota bacterium]